MNFQVGDRVTVLAYMGEVLGVAQLTGCISEVLDQELLGGIYKVRYDDKLNRRQYGRYLIYTNRYQNRYAWKAIAG